MSILNTYEKFIHINTEFINFIDELVKNNFKSFSEEQIKMNLDVALRNYEDIKFESDELIVAEENKNNLNDLKYLIMSGLFLVSDLRHFYSIKEYDRFRMRAVNYINNSRRSKIF